MKRKPPKHNVRRAAPVDNNWRGVVTNKEGETVQFESYQELLLICLLERSRRVKGYRSQPLTITFYDEEGKQHTYTPDFKVWVTDGSIEVHEVTVEERQNKPNIQRRELVAFETFQAANWRYILHNDKTLPQGTEAANLIALFRYRALVSSQPDIARLTVERIQEKPVNLSHYIQSLCSELCLSKAEVTSALCHMIWHGTLTTNPNQLIFVDAAIAPSCLVWRE